MFRSMVFGVLLSVWFCVPVQAQVTGEAGGEFAVEVDKAKIMRLPRTAAAVIVGNPAIADATVHDGRLLLITGKIFGGTNIIALDARGNVIVERDIQVRAPQMAAITYYRGGQQRSFTCAGTCEPTPSIGDDKDHFNTLLRQQKSKSEQGKNAALPD